MHHLKTRVARIASFAAALTFCSALALTVAQAQTTVKEIDTECNAIQDAVMALHPIHVVLQSSQWNVVSDDQYAVAQKTQAGITFADVYRQKSNYAWVNTHSFDAQGNQRATQLCFRQSDGSLERVRQATTVPDLSAASAQQAYYSSSGDVLQKTSIFAVDDPAIVKSIKQLPFYSVLPK